MVDLSFSLSELEFFLLIVIRVTTFLFAAPYFSNRNTVPNHVKIAFGFLFAVCLYRLVPYTPIEYNTIFGYAVLVLKEAVTGLLIGYGTQIVTTILNLAGHISDMETGLSMVTLFDPTTNQNITITGAYYQYAMTLMLVLSGLFHFLIAAFKESYLLIPINGAIFKSENLMLAMIEFLRDYITIGFKICLPIFAVMLLLNSLLGILAKVSPQMNMFAVGMQLKVLVGLGVLFLTVGMLPGISSMLMKEMQKMVTMITESLL